MLATYASVLAVCVSSLAIGQAALALCGWRDWSWLAPPTGLALVTALCWGTVRLPGNGTISAVAVLLATAASAVLRAGRVKGGREALRKGAPVAIGGSHEIPIESIRLKRIRNAREDYEYLRPLERRGRGDEAMDVASGLFGPPSRAARSTTVGAAELQAAPPPAGALIDSG